MTYQIRRRPLPPQGDYGGRLEYWREGPGQPPGHTVQKNYPGIPKSWQGYQETVSESHPNWYGHKRGRFQGDIGGDFTTTKRYVRSALGVHELHGSNLVIAPSTFNVAHYKGTVLPTSPNNMPIPSSIASSDAGLAAWGTKAIAACKPTNAIADVSTFLGELLRDGLPRMTGETLARWEEFTNHARKAGDEYLNVEFGWKPFIRDLRRMSNAIVQADKVMRQYERDSGKVVRRRFSFDPVVTDSATTYLTNVSPYIMVDHAALHVTGTNQGKVYKTRTTRVDRWFSGGFTYHLPKGKNSLRNRLASSVIEAKKLLGLTLTPETVWNLTPWSWATDWLFNTGDVLSNLSDWAVDGLVLKYGYIMEHSSVVDTYVFSGPTDFQSEWGRPDVVEVVNETKLRRRATPFGFGITWNSFTAQQAAIAAALGLSRS